jgi:hypothetical protein
MRWKELHFALLPRSLFPKVVICLRRVYDESPPRFSSFRDTKHSAVWYGGGKVIYTRYSFDQTLRLKGG